MAPTSVRGGESERPTLRFRAKPCVSAAKAGRDAAREVDVNGDGRIDLVELRRDGAVHCREMDLDFDGDFDLTRFFERNGRTVREELDLDQDGRLDQVTVHRDGQRLATILDTNSDGVADTYRCLRGARTVLQANDLDFDGRIDRWEWYDESGQMLGSSPDDDWDGVPDRLPPQAPPTSFCPVPLF